MEDTPIYYPCFNENVDPKEELLKVMINSQRFLDMCTKRKLTQYDIVKLRRWGITYKEREQLGIKNE